MKQTIPFKLLALTLVFLMVYTPMALAQSDRLIYMEDEGMNLWQEQTFIDSSDAQDSSFGSGGGEYIGDAEVQALTEAAMAAQGPNVNLAAALAQDQEMFGPNVIWGLATGGLMGVWFALLLGTDARDNTRYIGSGLVLGAILGSMVGTKNVFKGAFGQNERPEVNKNKGLQWAIQPVLRPDSKGNAMTGMGLKLQF